MNWNTESKALIIYMNKAKYFKQLQKEEVLNLIKLHKIGDKNATEKLVNSHIRFVISSIKKYIGCGLSVDDLIQEGNTGILKAADKFQADKGYCFTTYSNAVIKNTIIKALCKNNAVINVKKDILEQKDHFIDHDERGKALLFDNIAVLKECVSMLPDNQRIVIESRFLSSTLKTLDEIASENCMTRQNIMALEKKALKTLKTLISVF